MLFITGVSALRFSAAVQHAVSRARDAGTLIAIDPNIRRTFGEVKDYGRALNPLRAHATVAFGDTEELIALAGADDDPIGELLRIGYTLIVAKKGADGAAVYTAQGERWEVPSQVLSDVDTVGAGDAFAAQTLISLMEGGAVQHAVECRTNCRTCHRHSRGRGRSSSSIRSRGTAQVTDALSVSREERIIAIVRSRSTDQAAAAVSTLSSTGLRAIEVSLATPGALEVVRDASQRAPTRSLVGRRRSANFPGLTHRKSSHPVFNGSDFSGCLQSPLNVRRGRAIFHRSFSTTAVRRSRAVAQCDLLNAYVAAAGAHGPA